LRNGRYKKSDAGRNTQWNGIISGANMIRPSPNFPKGSMV
jgi:hypothetical protein